VSLTKGGSCWTGKPGRFTLHGGEGLEGFKMTEAEWLECSDPQKMLRFLRDKVSDRRLRLTACAGFRKMMHMLPFRDLRDVISVEEQYADKAIGKKDANDARIMAHNAMLQVPYKPPKTMTERWLAETLVHMASSQWIIAR
jgi:hypothetical protein